jgi:hypothetical protein
MTPDELVALERRMLNSGPVREAQLTLSAIRPLILEVRQSWAARDAAMAEVERLRKENRNLRSIVATRTGGR